MRLTAAKLQKRDALVEKIVELLATGRYDELVRLAPRSRLTAAKIQAAVKEYGRHLVPLPPSAREHIRYVPVRDAGRPQWSVVVSLFTEEEGRSDLSLELSMVALEFGDYEVQIDDIHVL